MSRAGWPLSTSPRSSSVDKASGIEADDVLPCVSMSRRDRDADGQFQRLHQRLDDAQVRLVRNERAELLGATPAASRARWATGAIFVTAHRNTVWPAIFSATGGNDSPFASACCICGVGRFLGDGLHVRTVAAPHDRADARTSGSR